MRLVPTTLLTLALAASMPALHAQSPSGQALIQQFQHVEDAWSIALVHKDQFALENLLTPAFVDIAANGDVNTRNQIITDALTGEPEPLISIEQKVVNVRVVSDVAVVEGTYILHFKQQDRNRDERGIFTHVYERTHNQWSCISAQRTAIVNQVEGGKKATVAQKTSRASQPFHIPLLYKGAPPKTPEQTPGTPTQ
jgi:hypothetical protein